MGWLISIPLLLVCFFSDVTISPDTILIAAALFALAGSISFAATSISSSLTKKKNEKTEE